MPTPPEPALRTMDLYRYSRAADPEKLVLRGISLNLWPGTVTVVQGPPGEARDALLGCLAGLLDPDGGTVWLCGERISHREPAHRATARRTHLGLLHRSGNLLASLTVADNIALAQQASDKPDLWPVAEVLARAGLTGRQAAVPSELSPDEAARAGFAVAVAARPAVLLADEPTAALTGPAEQHLLNLVMAAAVEGTAVLVATESPAVAVIADVVHELADAVWKPGTRSLSGY